MTRKEFLEQTKKVEDMWGDLLPLMTAEEAGELIQAVSKMERYKNIALLREELVKEMADVTISMAALCYRHGIDYSEVEKQVEKKLNFRYV